MYNHINHHVFHSRRTIFNLALDWQACGLVIREPDWWCEDCWFDNTHYCWERPPSPLCVCVSVCTLHVQRQVNLLLVLLSATFSCCFSPSPGGYTNTYLWHRTAAKYPFKNGQAASNDDIIADVLHDACGLTGHQGEEDGSWRESSRVWVGWEHRYSWTVLLTVLASG